MNIFNKLFGKRTTLHTTQEASENHTIHQDTDPKRTYEFCGKEFPIERPISDIMDALEQRPDTFKFFRRVRNEFNEHKEDWGTATSVIVVVDTKTHLVFRDFFKDGRKAGYSISNGMRIRVYEASILRQAFYKVDTRRFVVEQQKIRGATAELYERAAWK